MLFFENLTNVCHELLKNDSNTYSYLKKRRITENTINQFKLGSFPKNLKALYHKIHPVELREHNIIYNVEETPFKNYSLVIPINNTPGEPIAIGCRTLLSEPKRQEIGIPKYKNSIYSKSSNLFCLDKAIPYIRKKNKVFVVEGFFDAITAHQNGIKNVVASCGVLFSGNQLMILSRYTENIVILFDNDEAGIKNSKLIMNKYKNTKNVNFSCCFTPKKYKDLDEYLSSGGSFDYFEI